jgi:hypothetical protein
MTENAPKEIRCGSSNRAGTGSVNNRTNTGDNNTTMTETVFRFTHLCASPIESPYKSTAGAVVKDPKWSILYAQ